jgi:hypothetical protein
MRIQHSSETRQALPLNRVLQDLNMNSSFMLWGVPSVAVTASNRTAKSKCTGISYVHLETIHIKESLKEMWSFVFPVTKDLDMGSSSAARGAPSWKSQLQTEIVLSSTESEYAGMSYALRETISSMEILKETHPVRS